MIPLEINITQGRTSFEPYEVIRGTIAWQTPKPPKRGTLRLLWYTRGQGDEDVGVIDTIEYPNPELRANHPFEFSLPIGPYSFSGKYISLIWALELDVDHECLRKEFILSPTGKEILLSPKKP